MVAGSFTQHKVILVLQGRVYIWKPTGWMILEHSEEGHKKTSPSQKRQYNMNNLRGDRPGTKISSEHTIM